jgi:hypothetical protein
MPILLDAHCGILPSVVVEPHLAGLTAHTLLSRKAIAPILETPVLCAYNTVELENPQHLGNSQHLGERSANIMVSDLIMVSLTASNSRLCLQA